MAATSTVELKRGPSILVRILWYIFVGWWLVAILMGIAWFAALVIVGLPLTFYLVNRIPTALTLRPRREQYALVQGADGTATYRKVETQQSSVLVRAVYFVLIGWWLSAVWMVVAYLLMITVVGIPIGLMMINRLPFIFTLHRGYA